LKLSNEVEIMDVRCPKCGTVSEYKLKPGTKRQRKLCTNPECGCKFEIAGSRAGDRSPSNGPLHVTRGAKSGNGSPDGKLQVNGPNGPVVARSIEAKRARVPRESPTKPLQLGATGEQNAAKSPPVLDQMVHPGMVQMQGNPGSPSNTVLVGNCNNLDHEVATRTLTPKEAGAALKARGFSFMDYLIIKDLCKNGKSAAGIARENQWQRYKISRLVKRYTNAGLISPRDGSRGIYDANPDYFEWARKSAPIVPGSGTPHAYKIGIHDTRVKLRPLPGYLDKYQQVIQNLPILNTVNGWAQKYIPDADLGYFMFKKCRKPNFKVQATTQSLIFWPWGQGDTDAEARRDAAETGRQLHAMLEQKLGVRFTFEFGPDNPALPPAHYTIEAIKVGSSQVKIDNSPTHDPGTPEAVGPAGGATLTAMAQDLQSLPALRQSLDAITTQLDNKVKEAVAEAMRQAAPQFASAIKDAVIAGITQAFSQVPQAPGPGGKPAPSGPYT